MSRLTLSENSLTGPIPAELGNLSNLTVLIFRSNSLTGSIPPELGNLSSLNSLQLNDNSLTGPVPAKLGDLSSLTVLRLQLNQLTGELPSSFTGLTGLDTLFFTSNAGLCAPLDSGFQTWLSGVTRRNGPDCPLTRIWSGATVPVVGEPVFVELTNPEHRLLRINAMQAEYDADPCIGYDDTRGVRNGWAWERATSQAGPWGNANPGRHPHATFVYLPQDNDVGGWLRAEVTYGSTTVVTEPIGPVMAAHGVASGDQVSVDAPTGTVEVGNDLSATLPATAAAEREDTAINHRPEPWQWERSDDGSTDWSNVTPYHEYCDGPDFEYPLTTDDQDKHLRSYIYYNDDSSGSVVLKRGQTASVGPVTAP